MGDFVLNSREGKGILTRKNGDVISGTFTGNQPNGPAKIEMTDGSFYDGEVVRGAMTGNGYLCKANQQSFKGNFLDGQLHGDGTFFIEGEGGTSSVET